MTPELPPSDSMDPPLPMASQKTPEQIEDLSNKKVARRFYSRVEASRRHRGTLLPRWKRNVELRMGGLSENGGNISDEGDDLQSSINPDWALTKTKTANLYSQVPTVSVTHENAKYKMSIPPFTKALNYEIGENRANLGVAMNEGLNDVVNAAGVCGVLVSYLARFEEVMVPDKDLSMVPPEMHQQMMDSGAVQMVPSQRTTDYKFVGNRIPPGHLLWPKEFKGSNFDDAPWVGYDDELEWGAAKAELRLEEDDKEKVVGEAGEMRDSSLRTLSEAGDAGETQVVQYTKIFYKRYLVDPDEKSFSSIWVVVWVKGKTEPTIHEQWKGQQLDPQTRQYVGARRYPLQFLTLTYVSDNAIPPSDSAAGRPQVLDMQRSRTQMFMNRDRSRPLRWYDVNRVDPEIAATLMRGTWQSMIPTNGDGTRVLGEVARASSPAENITFDQQAKADLQEIWQIGPNQMGTTAGGDTTKGEAELVQSNFSTRIGQERGFAQSFFLRIVDVLAGLMVLYSDFPSLTDEEKQGMLQGWDMKHITHDLVLKVRPDSTVLLDTQQRIQRLSQALNLTAKSGYVNPEPIIAEIWELSGVDPSTVMIKPQEPQPEKPAISFRFSGKDDVQNPVVMALLVENGQAPSPQSLETAKKILEANLQPLQPEQPPQQGQLPLGGPPPPQGQGGGIGSGEDAHPDWHLLSKVAQRSDDMSQGM